jgi:glyoxylase-like metal-dependent hydrolase (beta-lactamase superfamily II)
VSLDTGFAEVVAEQKSTHEESPRHRIAVRPPTDVDPDAGPIDDLKPLACRIMNSGVARIYEKLFRPGGQLRKLAVPAMFTALEHPDKGVVLFDTGYTPRFYEGTRDWPCRLYRYATPVEVAEHETAVSQLDALGVCPDDVRAIVLSHFDPDHYGGLLDFPKARIYCSWRAWQAIAGKRGIPALLKHILPGHLPDDLTARIRLLPDFGGSPIGPLGPTLDLFDDDTIRLIQLPGHAPGHIGALVRDSAGRLIFLVADAVWSLDSIESCRTGLHHLLADDRRECIHSVSAIRRFADWRQDVVVVPSHCPETATSLGMPWCSDWHLSGSSLCHSN